MGEDDLLARHGGSSPEDKMSPSLMSNLACRLGTPGKRGPSIEELPPSDWPIGRSVGHFFDC